MQRNVLLASMQKLIAQTVVVNFVRATTSGNSRSVSKAFSITILTKDTFTLPADTGGDAQVETNAEGFAN